ncbi:L,D-transpeptidase family protein [Corynebacterium poyangense]|uniref:L,D-transpeptidase family protein n=1 Tax=Corynebacterium poyangense TaxID=2684405 RepID=A0A7H0SQP0_9CORY|nr:Ig-like domain-containing protein [Corynebacterium poyangense]QNQ90865.1 L,D-transpeptidase family protein [Corynebacterium poyangense]
MRRGDVGTQWRRICGALVCASALVLTGCTINGSGSSGDASQQEAAPQPPKISVNNNATDVNPTEPVTVKSQDEGLSKVTMVNENGYEVKSKLSDDGMSWTTDEVLGYYRTYTVTATDKNGEKTTSTFQTMQPAATVDASLSPIEGSTVGVGQTIGIRFSAPVNDRKAAQDAIKVTTDPGVEGAFYWLSDVELRWRPKDYWAPGTHVKVEAKLYGVNLGNDYYGSSDVSTDFTIGDRVISIVDDNTKTMEVYRNGELLRTIPVSLGSSRWPTPNGTYIIGDLNPSMVMDSETYGLSHDHGGYRTKVNWATQMSYSGIYVHGAPWSVWAQGNTNTSHGCVNVTDDAARWFQQISKRGDLVWVRNTQGGTLSGYDGLGDWNIPWETWKAGNADE